MTFFNQLQEKNYRTLQLTAKKSRVISCPEENLKNIMKLVSGLGENYKIQFVAERFCKIYQFITRKSQIPSIGCG